MNGPSRKPVVLVVDDVPANILILGEVLGEDCEILVATSGVEALEITRREQPDLVLLDVMMPGLDGYQVCARLKEDPWTERIPVIFVTARSDEQDEMRGLELGAVDYVTKPFSAAIVRARVRTQVELKRMRDQLERLSLQDGLTGLDNRRRFDEYLVMAWRHAAREQGWLSLAMVDIDCFKAFNDTYGHLAGDETLKAVGQAIRDAAGRPLDVVARYGGEEFGVLLPGTNPRGAMTIGEKIRHTVKALDIRHAGSTIADRVTVSVGLASAVPKNESSFLGLVEQADQALYAAKDAGRDRVRRYA